MDVRFTAEQRALRDSAAQLVDRLGVRTVLDLEDEARRARLDEAVASSGWLQLRTAGEDGAPWASGTELALVAAELARGLADTPFLGPTLAAEARRLAGAATAEHPETVLLSRDLSALPEQGEAGVAVDVRGAEAAVALSPDGTTAGVALAGSATGVDLTRPTAAVDGTATRSPLGTMSPQDVQRWMALGLVLTSADLVGAMRGALDLSVEYAKQRAQYGRPIGAFQAIGHLLADARVHVEGSSAALLHAAWAVDALAPADAVASAAAAKAYAARAAREVGEIAVQVHGGIGNTWECLVHLYLRRSLLATDVLGGVGTNLSRVLESAGLGGRY